MNRVLRVVFIKMYEAGDSLEKFREEMLDGIEPEVAKSVTSAPKCGSFDLSQVRESLYFFS